MKSKVTLQATSVVEHKHKGLPRFVCMPIETVSPWGIDATTTVEGTLNGVDIGRRSLKRWDERRCWFMDLPEALCLKARINTGDPVELSLRIASQDLPAELVELLSKNPAAKKTWAQLTSGQQRMLREEICAAKQSATRQRRARKALGCD